MIENNNIYLGDSYELIKEVPDKSVDLIITDPPYQFSDKAGGNLKFHYSGINKNKKNNPNYYINQLNDLDINNGIDNSILDELCRVMKKINLYIWCNKNQIYEYLKYFVENKKCNYEFIIWSKTNVPPFCSSHYLKDKEYCLFFWETGAELHGTYSTMKTVYFTPTLKEEKKKYDHPCIKPEEIIENMILNSSSVGGVVLDCFLGSGTTCAVAKKLKRKYIGFEKNEKYYQIAKDRLDGITQIERKQEKEISLFNY